MLFTSFNFALFFVLVFTGHWFVFNKSIKSQNLFLLVAGYFFYATWDYRFLLLLVCSSTINYFLSKKISHNKTLIGKRKILLSGVVCNALLLGYFKYFNFFSESIINVFGLEGTLFSEVIVNIVLPVGISFYTFQNISHLVDVYRGHSLPAHTLEEYALFNGFFPLLVSGPIERTNHLMPQLKAKRFFNYALAVNGMRMVLLGLFEKIVIADSCAVIVNDIYANYELHSGSTLFCNAVLYSFQVYGDFSGYSHIAIGCAALLGFTIRPNFNYPYLAKNIADFWRRWHISFSTWLRDYIFFPLGGSRSGFFKYLRNLFIVFTFSGLWHGATWNFLIYGCIHATLYILYVVGNKKNIKMPATVLGSFISGGLTFIVLTLARVFFSTKTVGQALHYLGIIFSGTLFQKPDVSRLMLLLMFCFLFAEWLQRKKEHLLDISFLNRPIRYSIYIAMVLCVLYFSGNTQMFVYFKF
jgi:alginate O-acetyltransferase complex protein AlgI